MELQTTTELQIITEPIVSYVFVHFETTGIPSLESELTRITEIGMLVVKRMHIDPQSSGKLPRITHKLAMTFNPCKKISKGAANVSGLNNELVQHETPFNNDAIDTIKSFLACQEKPMCLINHNGHKIGFPLLKNHFQRYGQNLPEDILCVDSRHGFYDILERPQGRMWRSSLSRSGPRRIHDVLASAYYNSDVAAGQEFSVNNIYERVLKRQVDTEHTAENRSVMIAQVAMAIAPDFADWVDDNCCYFSEVEALVSNSNSLC